MAEAIDGLKVPKPMIENHRLEAWHMPGSLILMVLLIALPTLILMGLSWGKILVIMICLYFIGIGTAAVIQTVGRR